MIGSYTIIKNEILWIRAHIVAWLPFLDQMVFLDGNSTDGTLEVIRELKDSNPGITLIENKDPQNLQDDYVSIFNEAISAVTTDLAFFLHPDMFPISGAEKLKYLGAGFAWTTSMESYAGEPGGQLYKILEGRMRPWKNIMRLKNPDLGLHYFGHYGAGNEDMYFRDITGDSHVHYGHQVHKYPYDVTDSGLVIAHYSDVRPFKRRYSRMVECLKNQGLSEKHAEEMAKIHPRVTLQNERGFKFQEAEYPDYLKGTAHV